MSLQEIKKQQEIDRLQAQISKLQSELENDG